MRTLHKKTREIIIYNDEGLTRRYMLLDEKKEEIKEALWDMSSEYPPIDFTSPPGGGKSTRYSHVEQLALTRGDLMDDLEFVNTEIYILRGYEMSGTEYPWKYLTRVK